MTGYYKKGQIIWLGKDKKQPARVTSVTSRLIKALYIDEGSLSRTTWIPKGQEQYELLPVYKNGLRTGKWA